ncbi:FAD-dependent oxidoreductase [Metabacillus mangrovi]|nr:FAD-dependent oxidoreductase [Metabacillus mangrovi]
MKTIILAGGGHAHLAGISKGILNNLSEARIIMISPSRYQYYSGMFSGFTEGLYQEEDIRIDLQALAGRHRFTFLKEQVTVISAEEKAVYTDAGNRYSFDLLSIDVGSSQKAGSSILPIKPNHSFPDSIRCFREGQAPVIAGGGAAGVELALAAAAYRRKKGMKAPVTLISGGPLLSSSHTNHLQKICSAKGVQVIANKKASLTSSEALEAGGETIPFSGLLWLTGPEAPALFKESGMGTDEHGFLSVDDRLSYSDSIFAAGDCAAISSYPKLPKNGVYAVRQSEILWKNLIRSVHGEALLPFEPQKRYLAILSTGDREGFLTYGGLHYHGSSAWKLKNVIDRRYMNSF